MGCASSADAADAKAAASGSKPLSFVLDRPRCAPYSNRGAPAVGHHLPEQHHHRSAALGVNPLQDPPAGTKTAAKKTKRGSSGAAWAGVLNESIPLTHSWSSSVSPGRRVATDNGGLVGSDSFTLPNSEPSTHSAGPNEYHGGSHVLQRPPPLQPCGTPTVPGPEAVFGSSIEEDQTASAVVVADAIGRPRSPLPAAAGSRTASILGRRCPPLPSSPGGVRVASPLFQRFGAPSPLLPQPSAT